jgi:hypothetical protein
MLGSSNIYASDSLRIDYFWNDANGRGKLAFVFSGRGNRILGGNSFGGDFLLANGFDVVAFKSSEDDWFQKTPADIFVTIDALCAQKGYRSRVSMANSMGAYAAIAFSRLLKLDAVVAYSPQYSVLPSFDRRFEADPAIDWRYVISCETIAETCRFVIVYDKLDIDRFHVRALKAIIPAENFEELILPYTGHGVTTYLHEIGRLKDTTLSLLQGRRPSLRELRAERRRSGQYLIVLTHHLARRRKYRALAAVAQYSSHCLRQRNHEAITQEAVARQYRLLVERATRPGRVTSWALASRLYPIAKLFEWLEIARLERLGFDETFYARKNTDVLQFRGRPILHFVRHGRGEGRLIQFRG